MTTSYSVTASGSGPTAVGDRATAIQNIGTVYNVYEATESIAPITAALKDRTTRLLDRHALFGGRDTQLQTLSQFADQQTKSYLFVTARSGFGKTALLANWVRHAESSGQNICYQFISAFDGTADEDFTFRNLCQQLAQFHGLQGTLPLNVSEVRALYPKLLRVPPPAGKRLTVVIDGLDESSRKGWAPGPDLFPPVLPEGIHVIFSARAIADTDWLANLEISPEAARVLELSTLAVAEIEGVVKAAVDGTMEWALNPPFVNGLFQVSGGDPFFLRYLVEDVRDVPIKTLEQLNRQPRGLKAYLDRWWAEVSDEVGEAPVLDLLGYLLVSKGPISRADLIGISDTDKLNGFTFDRTISKMRRYVFGDDANGYTLCHPRFQEYLARERILANDQRPYRAALLAFCRRWYEHHSEYALRNIAAHLADAVSENVQPQRHEYTIELVELVTSRDFQAVHLQTCREVLELQADLDCAVASAAKDDHSDGVLPFTKSALERVAFGQELNSKQVFDTATDGDLNEAERHLEPYSLALDWNRAVLLILAWLAADRNPYDARKLHDQVRGGLSGSPGSNVDEVLLRLDAWLRSVLDGTPLPPSSLPEPPGWMPPPELASTIIRRLRGEGESMLPSGGLELLSRGLSEQLEGSGFLAESDAPMLVALAAQDPTGAADSYLERYLELHATNPYAQYRNGSLWQILRAVLKHPDPAWVRRMSRTVAQAALNAYRVDFREGLPLALVGSKARLTSASAVGLLENERDGLLGTLARLAPGEDPWGALKRRAAMLAEIFASLGRIADAQELLDKLPGPVQSFAGFQAPACVTISEARRIYLPADTQAIAEAFGLAESAAHNIQSPTFCARTTAQLTALRLEQWNDGPAVSGIASVVERLVGNRNAPEFSSVHVVGEQFNLRVQDATKLPLPALFYSAQTLAEIATMFHVKLDDLLRLNRDRFASTAPLPPGALLSIPDPDCPPLIAAHLSAQICADSALPQAEQIRLLSLLVSVAVSNPTALDTVLARLMLTIRPTNPQLIGALEDLVAQYPIGGQSDPEQRVYLSIDYATGQIDRHTRSGDSADQAPVLEIGIA